MNVAVAITAADVALGKGDGKRALAKLLDAWRALRHPRIADLIDHVSSDLAAKMADIEGNTLAARMQAWKALEQKRDPAVLGRLLAMPWPGTWRAALPILERLIAWPDDPRIAMALAKLVDDAAFDSSAARKFYGPLFARLDELRDLRALPLLREQRERSKPDRYARAMGWLEERAVKNLEDAFLDGAPALAAPVERAITKVEERFAERIAAGRSEADHLAAICAAPDDMAVRAVYADWLQERGDPRGEFIALQLTREAGTGGNEARERKLLAQYGRAWAGALAKHFLSYEFVGGLFAGGELATCDLDRLDELLRDPAWRFVRQLSFEDLHQEIVLLERPELARVRVVDVSFDTTLALAAGKPRPIEVLRWRGSSARPEDYRALTRAQGLPHLRVLGLRLHDDDNSWLANAPVLERVERLEVFDDDPISEVIEMAARYKGALREIEYGCGCLIENGWTAVLSRSSAPGPFTRLAVRYKSRSGGNTYLNTADRLIGRVPDGWLRELSVTTPKVLASQERERIAQQIKRFPALDSVQIIESKRGFGKRK